MSLRLSEPPLARRTRTFLRRWGRGSFQTFLEGLDLPPGGTVALLDPKKHVLAMFRGKAEIESLQRQGSLSFGQPTVATLVGDIDSLPKQFVDWLRLLLETLASCKQEVDGLSDHALQRHRELNLVYEFTEASTSALAMEELLALVVDTAVRALHASGARIQVMDEDGENQEYSRAQGTVPSIKLELLSQVLQSGVPVAGLLPETLRAVHDDRWSGALVCLPMRTAGKSVGTLTVAAAEGRMMTSSDERILTALATLAATRIEQIRLQIEATKKRELAAVGHMASAIVHDFKNPLTAIRGFAEMIAIGAVEPEENTELAEQIVKNADRLWSMVDELLHFVRGSAKSLEPREVPGPRYAEHLHELLDPTIPSGIRLDIDLEVVDSLFIDLDKFDRVMVNLVKNAVEAIKGTGLVSITGAIEEGAVNTVRIQVCDDGPGIPKKVKEHLFEPFFTSGKTNGTGLGLSIVQKFIRDHGGTVEVFSQLGQGSCFTIRVPRKRFETTGVENETDPHR